MNIIDTHAHLYDSTFSSDIKDIITRSKAEHIEAIYMPNIDLTTIKPMLALTKTYPICKPMLGLHPCYVDDNFKTQLNTMAQSLPKHPFTAIGEIGIDLYHKKETQTQQIEALQIQLQWAINYKLPIVLHCRESIDQVIAILAKTKHTYPALKGILHCFTGTLEQAQKAINMDFYLGIGGIVTFTKNNALRELLTKISLKNIVLETDSPYLAPLPYQGKRNEPAYLTHIIKKIALIKNVPAEEVINITTANARAIFGSSSL